MTGTRRWGAIGGRTSPIAASARAARSIALISEATLSKLTIRARDIAAALLSLGAAVSSTTAYAQETLIDLIRTGQRAAVFAAITSPDLDVNAAEPDGSTPL